MLNIAFRYFEKRCRIFDLDLRESDCGLGVWETKEDLKGHMGADRPSKNDGE